MKKDMRRETTANNSTHISTGSTWMTNEYNANYNRENETSIFSKRNEQKLHFSC